MSQSGSCVSTGPGLDQSGPDGEEIIRVHLICTKGLQNEQVFTIPLNTGNEMYL